MFIFFESLYLYAFLYPNACFVSLCSISWVVFCCYFLFFSISYIFCILIFISYMCWISMASYKYIVCCYHPAKKDYFFLNNSLKPSELFMLFFTHLSAGLQTFAYSRKDLVLLWMMVQNTLLNLSFWFSFSDKGR